MRKLACAFFKCSIYPLNSYQIEHKGGSKLPHSKAPSARDRKSKWHWAGRRRSQGIQPFFVVLFTTVLLSAGCGHPSTHKSENSEPEIDWGREVSLDEMVAMAREGRIQEIQWHVMPNILRAKTSDDEIYHLRNENKGVDLRNTLIEAGVPVGKGGILFRHVF